MMENSADCNLSEFHIASGSATCTGLDRSSHLTFLLERDFDSIVKFWASVVKSNAIPEFLSGDSTFGCTDLPSIHAVGLAEYSSTDPRFKKKTFALQIGYDGDKYSGYQQQRGVEGVLTVEDDLDKALGRKVMAAGRTDKGVSAISQVVSFSTFDEITSNELMDKIKQSEAGILGRLNVWNCKQVPRKFNALFSATWRRYIYMFPLNSVDELDFEFLQLALRELENKELPYNAYAYREDRSSGGGGRSGKGKGKKTKDENKNIPAEQTENDACNADSKILQQGDDMDKNAEIGSISNHTPDEATEAGNAAEEAQDLCTMFRARATIVDISQYLEASTSSAATDATVSSNPKFALCIELVGSRFLRRMVRILTATAIREAVRSKEAKSSADSSSTNSVSVSVLVDIAVGGSRAAASLPLPGSGLALAGVGYDLVDLAKNKHNPCSKVKPSKAEKKIESRDLENHPGLTSSEGRSFDSSEMDKNTSPSKRSKIESGESSNSTA